MTINKRLTLKDTKRLTVKDREICSMELLTKRAEVVMLISDKIDMKFKKVYKG